MQRLEVSCAVRPIYGSLGVKRLTDISCLAVKKTVVLSGPNSVGTFPVLEPRTKTNPVSECLCSC